MQAIAPTHALTLAWLANTQTSVQVAAQQHASLLAVTVTQPSTPGATTTVAALPKPLALPEPCLRPVLRGPAAGHGQGRGSEGDWTEMHNHNMAAGRRACIECSMSSVVYGNGTIEHSTVGWQLGAEYAAAADGQE